MSNLKLFLQTQKCVIVVFTETFINVWLAEVITIFPVLLPAIFHNNCMFIAHHLMTLGHQFSKSLPSNISSTFVDLIPKVRKLGAEHFLQQLATQRTIMATYLENAKGRALRNLIWKCG